MKSIFIKSNLGIELSESQKKDCYDLRLVICDFGVNKNNAMLDRNTIDEWKDTLIHKPLVGKIVRTLSGDEDFSGHNAKKVKKIDENGNIYEETQFDTQAFGTFYDVNIETINGVDYLTARAYLWKRFSKACEIIKSKVSEGGTIGTSWEISIDEAENIILSGKKVKKITKGVFIGHAILGDNVIPAYDSSKIYEVAQKEASLEEELSNAIIQDLQDQESIAEKSVEDIKITKGGN